MLAGSRVGSVLARVPWVVRAVFGRPVLLSVRRRADPDVYELLVDHLDTLRGEIIELRSEVLPELDDFALYLLDSPRVYRVDFVVHLVLLVPEHILYLLPHAEGLADPVRVGRADIHVELFGLLLVLPQVQPVLDVVQHLLGGLIDHLLEDVRELALAIIRVPAN